MNKLFIFLLITISTIQTTIAQRKFIYLGNQEKLNNYQKYYSAGLMDLYRKDFEKSIVNFSNALQILKHRDAYFNRALAYNRIGNKSGFCKDLDEARILGDKDADSLYCLKCIKIDTFYLDSNGANTSPNNSVVIYHRETSLYDSSVYNKTYKRDSLGFYTLPLYTYKFLYVIVDKPEIVQPKYTLSKNQIENLIIIPPIIREQYYSAKAKCTFQIDKDGNVYNIKELEGTKKFNSLVAKKIMKLGKWVPASYNGEYVDVVISIDINYVGNSKKNK
jgi:tetratricopeptide (TPR) repeat protein